MKLTVAIATHRRPQSLKRTLTSLARAEGVTDGWNIVVVENGGRCGADAVCEESPLDIEYHALPKPGVGRARQYAVDRIGDGLVLFLDDDVRVCPGLLTEYRRSAYRNGAGTFYGGPILIDYEERPPGWLLPFLPPSVTGWDAGHRWPWFLGSNFAAFAEDINSAGGFSPGLGPGAAGNPTGDETDLQLRMTALGYRQHYVDGAKVWHHVEAASCTPEWALHRRYRNSVGRALLEHGWYEGRILIGGVPLWLYAKLMVSGAKRLGASLAGNRSQRFRREFEFQANRGRVRGARLRAAAQSR